MIYATTTTWNLRSKSFFRALALLGALTGGPLAVAQTGELRIAGVSETAFNQRTGQLVATLRNAKLAPRADAISAFINGRAADARDLRAGDQRITLDYEFSDGVNDVLIIATTHSGATVRADALLWAGDSELVVDLVDADMQPVSGARVEVALADNMVVKVAGKSQDGSARFVNLPRADLVVSVTSADGQRTAVRVQGNDGAVLLRVPAGTTRK